MPIGNPFKRLENPKAVWAWGMFDLANQSFQLIINTLLFGVYLKDVVASDEKEGTTFWARILAGALIVVVLLSPIVGAIVDAKRIKVQALVGSGVIAALLTGMLALVGRGDLAMAAMIYIPAAILVGLGENILAAFLPQLASAKNMGFVSALGWTMSYVGAIVLQICVIIGATLFQWKEPEQWRPLFIFAGVWFFLGVIPSMLFLRERLDSPPKPKIGVLGAAMQGFHRLGDTVRSAKRYRQLVRFLIAFFVFSFGTQTVVYFAAIIGRDFKFQTNELFLMTLVLSITAGVASAVLAKYQDRLGGIRTLVIVLLVWIATTFGLAAFYWMNITQKWALWTCAIGIGIGLGGIGSSARAVVGCFTPAEKSAEFFGLWGMVYKAAGVIGTTTFAYVWNGLGPKWALLVLAGFFAAGLALLRLVNEREGILNAGNEPSAAATTGM